MATPRREIMPANVPACYHCTTHCVRDLYLLQDEEDTIRSLILDRLRHLADHFAIDIMSYAIMHSHYHVVIFVSPLLVETWSDREVVVRWLMIYPGHRRREIEPPHEARITETLADPERVAELRRRLCDPGWFFKALNEWIARMVNTVRGTSGRVWEKRFDSRRLLDLPARVAACAYGDLNPIRAGMAETPEESRFTSVQERAEALRDGVDESTLWLSPISARHGTKLRPSVATFGPERYVSLVDATGRRRRPDKRGWIDPTLPPILERLAIDAEAWQREMFMSRHERRIFGTAVGAATSRARESIRRKVKWIVGVLDVYIHDRDPPRGF